jgi:hypothetical protein
VLHLLSPLLLLGGPDSTRTPARTQIDPPRIEAAIVVDGNLNEPAWRQAALLTGFSRYLPVEGPAVDSTEVLVWYSPTAIHFGIRAYEAHGTVNATLADRDRIFGDDNIQLFLDTYNDRRQAVMIAVNAFGVQADGAMIEIGRTGGGIGGGVVGGREPTDLAPDFVFQSKGQLMPWGFQVEIRIPFKSLRYQTAETQSWGFHVIREVTHAGAEDSWIAARRDAASFLAQAGELRGLTGMRRGLVVDATPEITRRWDGAPAGAGWDYTADDFRIGGNVRWGVTENLTLNGTIRPDFSQVESDAGQIQFDPRVAIFFPERRPFFLDGLELFNSPNSLIYTRRLVQPDGAAKLTGKVGATNIGIIAGFDGDDYSRFGSDAPLQLMTRVQGDIGRQSRLGGVFTSRSEDGGSNQVIGIDGRFVFGGVYAAQFQVARSFTTIGNGPTEEAPLWQARFTRSGRRVGLRSSINAISDEFQTWSGFIGRRGIVIADINPNYTWEFARGSLLQQLTTDIRLNGTWQYRDFVEGRDMQDEKLHLNASAVFRGGWNVSTGVFIETFGYDAPLYADYYIVGDTGAGVVDTVAYVGTPDINNLDVFLQLNTPQFQRVSANAFLLYGHDENFFEWSSGEITILNAGANWRPTDQMRLGLSYNYQRVDRVSDGSNVNVSQIPRLTIEYQVARPLFLRLIGQYVQNKVDSLRDDSRTELPIYIDTGTGLERAVAEESHDFRLDALLSYRPTPGTVLFAGYGSSYTGEEPYKFTGLQRTIDGFFFKLSYLFRL